MSSSNCGARVRERERETEKEISSYFSILLLQSIITLVVIQGKRSPALLQGARPLLFLTGEACNANVLEELRRK